MTVSGGKVTGLRSKSKPSTAVPGTFFPHHGPTIVSQPKLGIQGTCHLLKSMQPRRIQVDDDGPRGGATVDDEAHTEDEAAANDNAADDDDAPPEGEAPRGSADPPPAKRLTKSELFAMYKGKGPHVMNLDILSEDKHRAHACIVVHVAAPLHEQYQSELKAQSEGLLPMLDWVSARANGAGMDVVHNTLKAGVSTVLYTAMRCAPHCNPAADFDHETMQDDIQLAEQATKFSVELAANCAWAQQLYSLTLPLCGGVLLSRHRAAQVLALKRLKVLVLSILLGEKKSLRSS